MFGKAEEKQQKNVKEIVNQTSGKEQQNVEIQEKQIMTIKKDEQNLVDLTFKISEEDFQIYKILFDKIKQENPKIDDEELNRMLFLNLLTYTFAM